MEGEPVATSQHDSDLVRSEVHSGRRDSSAGDVKKQVPNSSSPL